MQLNFDIRTWWHAGAGRSSGNLLNALVVKDAADLPILPGRTVKGLVRDAIWKAESWGHLAQGTSERLCGRSTILDPSHPNECQPGALAFDNATLPAELAAWLSHPDQEITRQGLSGELYATAIEEISSRAASHSLRGVEVSVPLVLQAGLDVIYPERAGDWINDLKTALPLLRGLGGSRHRGLGRVVVTLQEVDHVSATV